MKILLKPRTEIERILTENMRPSFVNATECVPPQEIWIIYKLIQSKKHKKEVKEKEKTRL